MQNAKAIAQQNNGRVGIEIHAQQVIRIVEPDNVASVSPAVGTVQRVEVEGDAKNLFDFERQTNRFVRGLSSREDERPFIGSKSANSARLQGISEKTSVHDGFSAP